MNEITSFSGIFERLSTNVEDGNTIVFFGRRLEGGQWEDVLLNKVDLDLGVVKINPCNQELSIPEMFLTKLSGSEWELRIDDLVEFFDVIHLNWNPSIYDFAIARECEITSQLPLNQFSLLIPPSSHDIEIRLFLQKHHSFREGVDHPKLLVKLF